MSEWIGAVAALAGAALGGVGSYLIARKQFTLQDRIERRKWLIQAYEEMYGQLSDINKHVLQLQSPVVTRMASEEISDFESLPGFDTSRLEMLVSFYAPELNDKISKIKLRLSVLVGMWLRAAVSSNDEQEARIKLARECIEASSDVIKQLAELKHQIGESARNALGFSVVPVPNTP